MKMKFPTVTGYLTGFLIVATMIYGCVKSNTSSGPAPGTTSVSSIIKNANDATIFSAALARTHLDTVFNGAGPFTVFVPTDAAFSASGISNVVLDKITDDSLKYFVLYHTLAANLLSSGLPAGPNAKVITANGDSIFVTNNGNSIYVNGVPLLAADVLASNGVVHALQRPLIPARGNILQTIQSDTTFTFFLAGIAKASQGTTNLDSILAVGGPFTLFVPTNNAFRSAGFASTDDINNASTDSIANIILYHVLPSRIFSPDMVAGQTAKTLNDSTILYSVGSSVRQIKGNQNTAPANTLAINVMATNGVLFVIDQVLEP